MYLGLSAVKKDESSCLISAASIGNNWKSNICPIDSGFHKCQDHTTELLITLVLDRGIFERRKLNVLNVVFERTNFQLLYCY